MPEQLVGTVDELGLGSVRGIGDWAVLNVNGEPYARLARRCMRDRAWILRSFRRVVATPAASRPSRLR